MYSPEKIRNIAIIAHIDHGKTSLLDGLLKQSNIFRDNQVVAVRCMDSYDQEQERGITIFAKHTSIPYKDYKINIIDTPGHADFSGEVERVLGMVNCVLLIIDAQDGPMPQTRFVLSKSLSMGLCPIVVFNKIDKPHADPERVLNETFDLFVELGANDAQLDFKYCYASAINGYSFLHMGDEHQDFTPLLDLIISAAPVPAGNLSDPFLFQAATVSYDDFVGRQVCGRILSGTIRKGQTIVRISNAGERSRHVISRVEGHVGLKKVILEEAGAGDIVCLSGIEAGMIGDTLCDPSNIQQLPPIHLDEPTVTIDILVNNGPFVGKSGKNVTMNKISERLLKEQRSNISYEIKEAQDSQNKISVAGRGELHLAVLLEAMRREGFEFCVSKPQVIVKQIDGVKCEPLNRTHIEVPEEYSGRIIEQMSTRKGQMQHLETNEQGITTVEFLIPTRGLMGYRNLFLTSTRGLGILTSVFDKYDAWQGDIPGRLRGVMVSNCLGKVNGFACFNLDPRGELFVKPGDDVYEGMIVGESNKEGDLVVNATRAKQLTNMRSSGTDEALVVKPPRVFNLEEAITYIENDELLEITPAVIRLRKKYMTENERKRA
jgi:GTP-binding protein